MVETPGDSGLFDSEDENGADNHMKQEEEDRFEATRSLYTPTPGFTCAEPSAVQDEMHSDEDAPTQI